MNEHSAWRLSLARQIAPAYAAQPHIEAVFVHGSVGRGWADEHSDLEMACIWTEQAVGDSIRDAARSAAKSIGACDWQWEEYDETRQAWHGRFRYREMEVEIGHWTHNTIDAIVADVVERYDTSQHWLMFNKQATVSVLQHGIVLHGEAVIEAWRQQAACYPEELAVAMVQQHLKFSSFSSQEMLARRGEIPLLYENNVILARRLVNLLFGLNRIYHPGFKWTRNHIESMSTTPRDFMKRLQRVFGSDCVSGTQELRLLIEETFDLVEKHLPQINLGPQRETFQQPYKKWELPGNSNEPGLVER